MSSRSINDLYLNNHYSESPSSARRTNTRSFHSGPVGNSRDVVNCTQKIKPEILCYSPVHYGKTNGVNNDFEPLNVAPQDRNTTVTHVSTSYIPCTAVKFCRPVRFYQIPETYELLTFGVVRFTIICHPVPAGVPKWTQVPRNVPHYLLRTRITALAVLRKLEITVEA